MRPIILHVFICLFYFISISFSNIFFFLGENSRAKFTGAKFKNENKIKSENRFKKRNVYGEYVLQYTLSKTL